MKVGDMIKCTSPHQHYCDVSYGIIVKLEVVEGQIDEGVETTWGEIVWADGHRTWEEMEVSLETCFEVISESRR